MISTYLKDLGYEENKFQTKQGEHLKSNCYFMSLACLTALRSPDPNTQIGACIINKEKRIIGLGYNDFPKRYNEEINEDFDLPLEREGDSELNKKYFYMTHAASNAILNKNAKNLNECSMYTTFIPCNDCFKLIVQSGIKNVYYLEDCKNDWPEEVKESIKGSKVMAEICEVKLAKIEFNSQPIIFDKSHSINENEIVNYNNIEMAKNVPEKLTILGFKPKYEIKRRNNILNEKDYYMGIAKLNSLRSKDPNRKVGACIVDNNGKIISCGYNGFPNNSKHHRFPWENNNSSNQLTVNSKAMYICHAELNAIINKYDGDVRNCTIYVTSFPCHECAKLIIQSQINKVIYNVLTENNEKREQYKATKVLFEKYNIVYEQHIPYLISIDVTQCLTNQSFTT